MGPPQAVNLNSLKAEQERCKTQACNESICAIAGMCPPGEEASHFKAFCHEGICGLKKR
jgi:hypothetical protein